MKLILARHGNTFGPQDTVVMAGLTNDLPLTGKGPEQAHAIAQAFAKRQQAVDGIYCSELQRTAQTAEPTGALLQMPIAADARLNELDYGLWTGLTDDEINAKFGEDTRLAWQKKSQWPENAGWGSSEQEVAVGIQAFAQDVVEKNAPDSSIFVVSSNGVLRYFLRLIPNKWEEAHATQSMKVKTGHLCQLSYRDGQWQVDFWNLSPEDAAQHPEW